jgi:RimJ/RimL family protein N-acetyltransferase
LIRLETERLVLRKPELGDRDGYAPLWGDPEVVRFIGGTTLPPEQVPKAIERMLGHWGRHGIGLFSVLRKEDQRLVGRVGYLLWDTERWVNAMHEQLDGDLELEIGWTILREFWSQGYATEAALACRDHAFGELGRDRVISLIARENVASIRVAEKIGESLEQQDIGGEAFKLTVDLYSLGNRPAR